MLTARSITLHWKIDTPKIDAFECSRCVWVYKIPRPQRYRIPYQDAWKAGREFDEHRCEDFPLLSPRRWAPQTSGAVRG